jgi:hypothetical protein
MKVALLIGCCYYGSFSLRGPHNDLGIMTSWLKNKGYTHIITLADTSTASRTIMRNSPPLNQLVNKTFWPFSSNLYFILNSLSQQLNSNDKLFIYFSGHGVQTRSSDSTTVESDKLDECLVVYQNTSSLTAYTDTTIRKHIDNLACDTFCLFDSCHSATMLDTVSLLTNANKSIANVNNNYSFNREISSKSIRTIFNVRNFPVNVKSKNINKIVKSYSGCADNTYSYDLYIPSVKRFHGALTWAFYSIIDQSFKDSFDFLEKLRLKVYEVNRHQNQIPFYTFICPQDKVAELFVM